MNNNKRIFVLFAVLSLVTTACSLSSLIGQNGSDEEMDVAIEEASSANANDGEGEPSPPSESVTTTPEEGLWIDNPAPESYEVVADNKTFTVTGATRPADELVAEANQFNEPAEDGEEYLLVELQISCTKSQGEQCEFTPFNMLVWGSLEDSHTRTFVAGLDNEINSVEWGGGETVSGVLPFLVGEGETDLVLIYQPFSGGAYFFTVPTP